MRSYGCVEKVKHHGSLSPMQDVFGGEGEFSLGPRKTSVSSRKSISALDVGLEEAGQVGVANSCALGDDVMVL